VGPIELACFRIEAMQEPGEVANEQQAVGGDGNRGDAAMDLVIGPDLAGLRDVPGLGGINAREDTYAFAVLRVLTDRSVNPVLPEYRRGVNLTGALGIRVLELLPLRSIAVIPPDLL